MPLELDEETLEALGYGDVEQSTRTALEINHSARDRKLGFNTREQIRTRTKQRQYVNYRSLAKQANDLLRLAAINAKNTAYQRRYRNEIVKQTPERYAKYRAQRAQYKRNEVLKRMMQTVSEDNE